MAIAVRLWRGGMQEEDVYPLAPVCEEKTYI